jgi:hypothetical protein
VHVADARRSELKSHRLAIPSVYPTTRKVASPVNTRAFIGSNLPTRRHYFRFPRNSGEIQKQSELFSKLPRGGWLCRLPQFDRISLRVMHAGEPAVRIRLRVNLDLDSSGL